MEYDPNYPYLNPPYIKDTGSEYFGGVRSVLSAVIGGLHSYRNTTKKIAHIRG